MNDEIGGAKLIDLQRNALAGNFYPEDPMFKRGPLHGDEMVHDVWEWCVENEESPRAVERTLYRYSTNFNPGTGGKPLVLGDEPPDDIQKKYPDWRDRVGTLEYE